MAFTFDATAAGASANSYVSYAEALDFVDGWIGPPKTSWNTYTTTDHQRLLVRATKEIEALPFLDEDKPADKDQELKFPRSRDPLNDAGTAYEVPKAVRDATVLQAMFLATLTSNSDADKRATLMAQGVKQYTYGDVSETFADGALGASAQTPVYDPNAFGLLREFFDPVIHAYRRG